MPKVKNAIGLQKAKSLEWDELNKMTNKELQQVIKIIAPRANKRLEHFSKSRLQSTPAIASLKNAMKYSGDVNKLRFKEKGFTKMKRAELLKEARNVTKFYRARTSSVKETYKIQRQIQDKLNIKISAKDWAKYWDIWDKVRELHPDVLNNQNMYNVIKEHINVEFENKKSISDDTVDDIVAEINRTYNEMYEQVQERENALMPKLTIKGRKAKKK